MSIESDLKRDGIEVISQIDTLKVNSIAKNIAQKICNTFPEHEFSLGELFMKLSRINMYTAKMPEGMAEANYFYKNSSIYFNEEVPSDKIEYFAIHECVHHLQEIKDKKNFILRLGLCDFTNFKIYGMALNEAAVQLISSKVNQTEPDNVKYFGISFYSTSPSYYPLECALVRQMAYLTGEFILFDSTFNSNDNFKNKFIELTSEKDFIAIQNALDIIMYAEEDIIRLNNKFYNTDNEKKIAQLKTGIEEAKNKVAITFMRTQNLILSSYFDKAFSKISNLEELDNYRRKLEGFRFLIGNMEGYEFYDNYYTEMMSRLEHKNNILENGGIETALELRRDTLVNRIFNCLRKLFFKNTGNINEVMK